MRRLARVIALIGGVTASVFVLPSPARADISGPCQAFLSGRDVTTADTRSTAVRVDYRDTVAYSGQTTDGSPVGFVDVTLELAGIDLRVVEGQPVNGPSWSSEASIERYATAGVGLYRVRGEAFGPGGELICTGRALLCVRGKSIFATVAGVAASGFLLLSLLLVVFALRRRRTIPKGRLGSRLGAAGILGGLALPVLLQQSCLMALSPVTTFGGPGAGLLLGILLGRLLGTPGLPAALAPPMAPPQPARPGPDQQPRTVYRFVPEAGACAACRSHAQHRVYSSMDAIGGNRAHPGCGCQIVPQQTDQTAFVAYFSMRPDVYDDRGA